MKRVHDTEKLQLMSGDGASASELIKMKKNLDYHAQEKLELEEKIKQLKNETEKYQKAQLEFQKKLDSAVEKEKHDKKKLSDENIVLKKKIQELEEKVSNLDDFDRYRF